jgi:hypothetical protein
VRVGSGELLLIDGGELSEGGGVGTWTRQGQRIVFGCGVPFFPLVNEQGESMRMHYSSPS